LGAAGILRAVLMERYRRLVGTAAMLYYLANTGS
jgi:hypothetical protein